MDLHLKSIAPGAVDINEAELIRTYHGWFWDDRLTQMLDPGDAILRPTGAHGGRRGLPRDARRQRVSVTRYIARLRATNLQRRRAAAAAIPIERSGFATVAPTEATVPLWLGLWANPVTSSR